MPPSSASCSRRSTIPVWTAAILKPEDFALALTDFLLLFMWKTPPWLVVLVSAAGGAVLSL